MDTKEPSWVQNIDFLPMIGLSCIQFRWFYIFQKQKRYLEDEQLMTVSN